ncbi:Choline monooxygenase (CMO-like), putative isoform 3 [Theobroma cacao]|uniref:Choline monooxygenase, chloroplastic n=1 Tax=Theobroma cacao TaxID=3641 RepID=A0A061ELP7_THECC|nr:Choline monooxygenase (CMO-like), putative isoform 3 [Theobroma cacao]
MTLLLKPISEVFLFQSHFQHPRLIANFSSVSCCSDRESYKAQTMVREFDPKIPIEKALTPPSSWYSDPSFYAFELDRVFYRGWQAVGYSEQIKEAHDYFTGRLGNVEFVVCRDDNGNIAAFHNVCRHHASLLVSGSGKKSCFTCPYHGWTYELNGALRKATRISGIQDFIVNVFEKVSIQSVEGGSKETKDDRLGSNALYAFIYPNFMINRYGPWMDTNLVIPLGPRRCLVVFDYFLEASLKDDKAFIERSLVDSERVQMEDITLCEGVQRGIESPAYCSGRYAPTVEKAMHHFHCLLYDNLIN